MGLGEAESTKRRVEIVKLLGQDEEKEEGGAERQGFIQQPSLSSWILSRLALQHAPTVKH